MRTKLSKLFSSVKPKTEGERRELHNRMVARNGRGIILLPTNVDLGDIRNHLGGLPPPR